LPALNEVTQEEFSNAVAVRGALADPDAEVGIVPALLDDTRVMVLTIPGPNEGHEVPLVLVVAHNKDLFNRLQPTEEEIVLAD
jgi:hypothetical protein